MWGEDIGLDEYSLSPSGFMWIGFSFIPVLFPISSFASKLALCYFENLRVFFTFFSAH